MEDNTPLKKSPSVAQWTLTYALLLGFGMIVVSLIFFLFDVHKNLAAIIVSGVLLVAGLAYVMYHFRQELGGNISYGKSVKSGFLPMLFAGIIIAGYTYVYDVYINPDELVNDHSKELVKEKEKIDNNASLDKDGKTIALKQKTMELKYKYTPWVRAIGGFVNFAVIGIVLALIIAIFIKRQEPLPTFEETA